MNSSRISVIANRFGFLAAILLCAVFALNAAAPRILRVPLEVMENPNEGWNAYFAARAMSGLPIYPQSPEMIVNNYPPLSFYITGLFGKLIGDFMVAGRLLSIGAWIAIAAILGAIVAKRTGTWRVGLFTAVYFAAVFSVFPGGRIGLNDPQLLAQAVMLAGFAIFWLGDGKFPSTLAGAAVMVIAGLIKHSMFALPIAITVWLAIFDRKWFMLWLATAGLSVLIAAFAIVALWGSDFFNSILTPRQYSLSKAVSLILVLRQMLPSLTIFILLCFLTGTRSQTRDRDFWFPIIFVASSLVVALALYGGEGTASNVAFELVISVVLAIGLSLAGLPDNRERTAVVAALTLAQYFMITAGLGSAINGAAYAQARNDRADIEYVASLPGDAICSEPTLCYYAKKDFVLDFFNMNQLYALKRRNPRPLLDRVRRQEFSVIALTGYQIPSDNRPWIVEFLNVLNAAYRADRMSDTTTFYVPRTSSLPDAP